MTLLFKNIKLKHYQRKKEKGRYPPATIKRPHQIHKNSNRKRPKRSSR